MASGWSEGRRHFLAGHGAGGIEQIIDVPLSDSEKAGMTRAAEAVKELVGLIG